VGALLRAIDGYTGKGITVCALMLAPLVFVRPGELRQAQWVDVDLANGPVAHPTWIQKTRAKAAFATVV
jgi:integrase